jgi:hypothetical protein
MQLADVIMTMRYLEIRLLAELAVLLAGKRVDPRQHRRTGH